LRFGDEENRYARLNAVHSSCRYYAPDAQLRACQRRYGHDPIDSIGWHREKVQAIAYRGKLEENLERGNGGIAFA
jgi:hypothetical protein